MEEESTEVYLYPKSLKRVYIASSTPNVDNVFS